MSKLHASAGRSGLDDAFLAGKEAAIMAVDGLDGESPDLIIVFTTPKYNLEDLLSGIRSVTGETHLIGATGSGEMVNGEHMGFGAGVALLALTAGPYRFGIASASHINNNLDQAGQTIARDSRDKAGKSPYAAVLLLADAMLGDLQQLFTGVYRVTGPKVAITGGAAGDELKFIASFVFHDDQVVEQGAVALWIASDHPIEVVTKHGWEPIGIPQVVTRAEGIQILELGGRPAATVYEEQLDFQPGQLTVENFWNTSIHHPFGLLQSDGTTVIRVARNKTEDGALRIQGCVPPTGSAVQVMAGTVETLLDAASEAAQTALSAHPDAGVLLAFSCAARATMYGKNTPEEIRRLQKAAGSIPVFGFYCCGEFSRTSGVLGTHNATLTAIAL